jgi:hypothetical protein
MSKYKIHLGYIIESSQENKECYQQLHYNLKDYNLEINSMYIDFKRGDLSTDRSINFDVNSSDILDIIQKIPREYIFVYVINIEDNYKIIYDYADCIRSKKLNEEEINIYNKLKETINKNDTENKYIKELENRIEEIYEEINTLKNPSNIKQNKTNDSKITIIEELD